MSSQGVTRALQLLLSSIPIGQQQNCIAAHVRKHYFSGGEKKGPTPAFAG